MATEPAHFASLPTRIPVALAGLLALLVGGTVLVGWGCDLPVLKSILPGWVSMKPNTALGFVLTGLALLFSRSRFPTPTLSGLGRLCGWLVGLVGLLTLAEYALDWDPGLDQWLFPEPPGTVATSHPGRMAPDTALCFLLLGMALETAHGLRKTRWSLGTLAMLGSLVTVIALVEVLSYFTPTLRTQGWAGLTMMALHTAILFAVLGATLTLIAWQESAPQSDTAAGMAAVAGLRDWFGLMIVFLLLTGSILAAGAFHFRHHEQRLRSQMEQQISAFADLKAAQIVGWRRERLADANFIRRTPYAARRALDVLRQPTSGTTEQMFTSWLQSLYANGPVKRVLLLDDQLKLVLVHPKSPAIELPEAVRRAAAEALQSRQIVVADLHRNTEGGPVQLSLAVPLLVRRDGTRDTVPPAGSAPSGTDRSAGVLVLQINAELELFPIIQTWPTPSLTAETLLVRREGDEVVFLNELRHRTNTALNLRMPVNSPHPSPAALAVTGHEGVAEGPDYRGVPVLAALRKVPDSPWFIVAKVDVEEMAAPLRQQAWMTALLLGSLIAAAALGTIVLWRQKNFAFLRQELALKGELHQSEVKFRALFEQAAVGVAQIDSHSGQFLSINRRYCDLIGYSESELLRQTFGNITHPDDLPADLANMERLLAGEIREYTMEKRYLRKDGSVVWVSLTVSPLWAPGETPQYHAAVVQDITERKQVEATRRQQAEELRAHNEELQRFNRSAVGRELRMIELKQEVNELRAQAGLPARYQVDSQPESGRKSA